MTVRHEPNPFWRFSLRSYRRPGAEAAFLALQQEAATDTNLLLYCCWQAGAGRALDTRALRRAMAVAARWQADVILPLRQARQSLKAAPEGLPEGWAADLRRRIGAAELDMEYAEQRALYLLAQGLPPITRPLAPRAAAQASIARYLALCEVAPTPSVSGHVQTVVDACFAAA